MKLSEWARRNGVHYQTAWSWARNGQMPVPVIKTATGRYLVIEEPADRTGRAVAYCRVSSTGQRDDLERQVGRVVTEATARGIAVAQVVAEVGTGADSRRPQLAKILADPGVVSIVVERRERLALFGVEYLEAAMAAHGREIVVLHDDEVTDHLVRDMAEILTSFCTRLYGRGSAARKAKAAVRAAEATA